MKTLKSLFGVLVAGTLIFATTATFAHNGDGGGKKKANNGVSNSKAHHVVIAGTPMAKSSAVKGTFKKVKNSSSSASAVKGTFKVKNRFSTGSAYKGVKKHRVVVGGSAKKNTVRCMAQR